MKWLETDSSKQNAGDEVEPGAESNKQILSGWRYCAENTQYNAAMLHF